MKEKLKRSVPYNKFYLFAAWPIIGILLIIYGLMNFNEWGVSLSVGTIIVGLFLLVYGSWALKRAWARM